MSIADQPRHLKVVSDSKPDIPESPSREIDGLKQCIVHQRVDTQDDRSYVCIDQKVSGQMPTDQWVDCDNQLVVSFVKDKLQSAKLDLPETHATLTYASASKIVFELHEGDDRYLRMTCYITKPCQTLNIWRHLLDIKLVEKYVKITSDLSVST